MNRMRYIADVYMVSGEIRRCEMLADNEGDAVDAIASAYVRLGHDVSAVVVLDYYADF